MSDQALGLIITAAMAWIVVCGIPMLIASRLAYNRGRSRGGAAAMAFLFGWLALPFIALMRTDSHVIDGRNAWKYEKAPLNIITNTDPDTSIDMRDYNERRHMKR